MTILLLGPGACLGMESVNTAVGPHFLRSLDAEAAQLISLTHTNVQGRLTRAVARAVLPAAMSATTANARDNEP